LIKLFELVSHSRHRVLSRGTSRLGVPCGGWRRSASCSSKRLVQTEKPIWPEGLAGAVRLWPARLPFDSSASSRALDTRHAHSRPTDLP
jgi:hypothetical protein